MGAIYKDYTAGMQLVYTEGGNDVYYRFGNADFNGKNGSHFHMAPNFKLISQTTEQTVIRVFVDWKADTNYSGSGSRVYGYVNGNQLANSYTSIGSGASLYMGSYDVTISHNSPATQGAVNVTCTIDTPWTLGDASSTTTIYSNYIPRQFTQTPVVSQSSATETTSTFTWSTSEACDWVRYYLDGSSSWVDVFGYASATSGSFAISNLGVASSHTIRIQCRRQDSGEWSYSNSISFGTYDYPKPNSVGNFTIGNAATVNVYNPLGRTYTLDLISNNNGAVIGTYSGAINGNVSGFNGSSSVNTQYASIPNSASGTYYARVTYGSSVKTKGTGTYSIKGTEKPVVTTTAIDNGKTLSDSITPSATTTDLTGNNKKIIKFISNVDVSVSATGQNSATISSYSTKYGSNAAIAGQPHTYENVESTTFTGTATDSRNLSNSANATGLTLINYIKVTLDNVELYRDVQTSNTLKCRGNGAYFSGDFGATNNSLTFQLRYKESSSSTWGSWSTKTMTIGTNTYSFDFQVGTSFDYTKTYDFQFKVTDKCMNVTRSETAKPGIPIQGLFESFIENFGIVAFSKGTNELVINGDIKVSGSNKYLKNL